MSLDPGNDAIKTSLGYHYDSDSDNTSYHYL